ncbi:Uncharacterized protein BP5553_03718 [Venustampulla echinocandica]|uniref:Uncharacterized protein n=1 Tax=Venustampulla echinocandica TaxID=2656787 RepID=A0A370TV82_9HELO|nr:Uncharacterized protein BP5553_03718 [Venustampulla echinocandica]RDL39378.1 Uncharacterized protein BP5553_03718 [Venustampulla echinocandica]
MASSSARYTLLADDQRPSIDSTYDEDERLLLGGLASTSPTRPLFTSFHPTLYTRALGLILALPAFIIFIIRGGHFAPSILFLSFAIARQVVVIGVHFGSRIVRIRVEAVHQRLKGVSAATQEKWIQRIFGLVVDGVILVGMLVTLSLNAHEVATCHYSCYYRRGMREIEQAVIVGFIAFGLLLISAFDFGSPSEVTMVVAIEKPRTGLLKFSSSLLYGRSEDSDVDGVGAEAGGNVQRKNSSGEHMV